MNHLTHLKKFFFLPVVTVISFNAVFAQPANDGCAAALAAPYILSSTGGCSATNGVFRVGTMGAGPTAGITAPCGNNSSPDVWYSFVAQSTFPVISINSLGTNLQASPRLQLFGTNSCTVSVLNANSLLCVSGTAVTSLSLNTTAIAGGAGLTIGNTYLIRVFTNGTSVAAGTVASWNFQICITDPPPANDICSNATTLPVNANCTPVTGNLYAATQSNPIGSCGNRYDVWYKFTLPATPQATYATIGVNLTSSPSTLNTSNTYIELFNTSTCPGDNNSLGCTNLTATTNPKSFLGLTPGATYLFRINTTSNTNTNPLRWGFTVCVTSFVPSTVGSGRMREVFKQTILSPPNILADPWEITYGPDNNLWITESKGYKVYKMDPASGAKTTVLDISQGSTFFSSPADQAFNCQFANGAGAQGGLAGLALHPKFLDGTPGETNYLYVSYVHTNPSTNYFVNRLVRFFYNKNTGLCESPVSLCDTLPGSNDHNSQRMIIAPITPGGTNYLFYASGDMGAGQGTAINANRPNKAQYPNSYEGKILRFSLDQQPQPGLDGWIPDDNPYTPSLGVESAVWCIGIRNNQGFVYDKAQNILYGSSHGPYSDDEINVIEPFRNYGHPLVIGYVADGNYDGSNQPGSATNNMNISAGAPYLSAITTYGNSSCPPIGSEATRRAEIDASGNGLYKDPLFSAYPGEPGTGAGSVTNIWQTTNGANGSWPSEGWSGLDLYTHTLIPGWKQSLVAASLKWGRLVRIKLGASGNTTLPNNDIHDTISYFGSTNRFRDLAFAPNGKDIYVILDRSATTSGPSAVNPIVPACAGCVQKYTFLGYADNSGQSTIPDEIPVTSGATNVVSNAGTTVTIDATNNNLWVPITGPDGNIMAEIFANGQNLGTVTSAFYQHSGATRVKGITHYLNRNITLTPTVIPASPIKIRLYISKTEFDALDGDPLGGVAAITDLKILRNTDAIGNSIIAATTLVSPDQEQLHGTDGYMLQADNITSLTTTSSFYFASSNVILPLELITFNGSLQTDQSVLLKWKTTNEKNTSRFDVERSSDGSSFSFIGSVAAAGNSSLPTYYSLTDPDATRQSSNRVYYRLRMIDVDGQFAYSNVVTITLPYTTSKVVVYPNPFAGEFNVAITAEMSGTIQWQLIDNGGRLMKQNTATVKKGNNSVLINGHQLPPGSYFLRISGAGIDQKVKLQKL